jgi:hypothetical protein
MATIFSPAASNRDKICPITFFATASGLMIDKVRSTAIISPYFLGFRKNFRRIAFFFQAKKSTRTDLRGAAAGTTS